MKLLVIALWIFTGLVCYTVPMIQQVDTTTQTINARQAQADLAQIHPADAQTQASLIVAGRALGDCAQALERVTKSNNVCSADLMEAKARYEKSQEQGGSLWSRIKQKWDLMVFSVVAFALGSVIGPTVFSMLWGALKAALKIS